MLIVSVPCVQGLVALTMRHIATAPIPRLPRQTSSCNVFLRSSPWHSAFSFDTLILACADCCPGHVQAASNSHMKQEELVANVLPAFLSPDAEHTFIQLLRSLAAHEMLSHRDAYDRFLPGLEGLERTSLCGGHGAAGGNGAEESAPSIESVVATLVLRNGVDAEHPMMAALAAQLGVPLAVVYASGCATVRVCSCLLPLSARMALPLAHAHRRGVLCRAHCTCRRMCVFYRAPSTACCVMCTQTTAMLACTMAKHLSERLLVWAVSRCVACAVCLLSCFREWANDLPALFQ